MKKYYVYALDVRNASITAAVSFPGENTAHEAFQAASLKMGAEGNVGEFQFGSTSDSQIIYVPGYLLYTDIPDAEVQLRIGFMSLPQKRYPKGKETSHPIAFHQFLQFFFSPRFIPVEGERISKTVQNKKLFPHKIIGRRPAFDILMKQIGNTSDLCH